MQTDISCSRGKTSVLHMLRTISNDGSSIGRLYRGVSATVAGCVPAHAAFFSVYEASKSSFGVNEPGHHPLASAACGALSTVSHDMVMTPLDVVKQRMQLGYYESSLHCARTIAKEEGMRPLFLSLPVTLVTNIPFTAVMVAVNESAKEVLNPSGHYNLPAFIASGALAGGVAAAVTTPFDVVKTRLQTQSLRPVAVEAVCGGAGICARADSALPKALHAYSGVGDVLRVIHNQDGVAGLFRGIKPRMLVQATSAAVSWTAYESIKYLLSASEWLP